MSDVLQPSVVKVVFRVPMEIDAGDWLDWVSTVTGGSEGFADVFDTRFCGYWLRGIKHTPWGWVAWEVDEHDEKRPELRADIDRAMVDQARLLSLGIAEEAKQQIRGRMAKHGYFLLDEEVAQKAWGIGVGRYGAKWYEEGDVNTYDAVLQLALIGEVRYG